MDGLSSGRLGWIRVKARTQSALTHAIIREAYSTFQDNEFDRFGLTTRRGKRGWEAVLLAERRAVMMSELPKTLNPGDSFRAQATWALEEAEGSYHGILGYHLGRQRRRLHANNGLCRIRPGAERASQAGGSWWSSAVWAQSCIQNTYGSGGRNS